LAQPTATAHQEPVAHVTAAGDPSPIGGLLVFGDSLADTGNAYALRGDAAFPCPPHWRGRRCDGPVWVEHLAAALDLPPPHHSLAGGCNFAHGGARSAAGLTAKGMPNLLSQVEQFLTVGDLGPPGSLAVLRAGANDYLDAPPSTAIAAAVNRHLLAAVERLAEAGLRRFLVPNELPWGFSPIQLPGLGEAERRGLNGLIAQQNAALQAALADLAERRQLQVVQPDFHGLFLAVRADPTAFGFGQIERPLLALSPGGEGAGGSAGAAGADGAACGPGVDGGLHLWWDSWAHLTTAFHQRLAVLAAVDLRRAWQGEAPQIPAGGAAPDRSRRGGDQGR
jgi:outer membrane lipase/esterase